MGGGVAPLPYDAEVEYLESSGTQYINTGIIANPSTIIRTKLMNLSTTVYAILGYERNGNNRFAVHNYRSSCYLVFLGAEIMASGKLYANTLYEYEFGNFYIKDIPTGNVLASTTQTENTATDYIYLNGNYPSKNRFYYFQAYDGNTLILDLIPVRVGQVGYMYDKISGRLFGNSGTGDFILGNDKTA